MYIFYTDKVPLSQCPGGNCRGLLLTNLAVHGPSYLQKGGQGRKGVGTNQVSPGPLVKYTTFICQDLHIA